jgi:shikimate kinase
MSGDEGVAGSGPVLVLVGSPGAGKSSVGRRVAQRLKVPFADTDALIEAAAGKSVSDIFVDEGEAAFRDLEVAAVARALTEHSGVLSLGGGAVMRTETRDALRGRRVVWLRVSLSDAAHRVGLNTARPLLLGNVRSTLSALLEQRTPLYEAVASAVVDTSGKSLRDVTDEVVRVVRGG